MKKPAPQHHWPESWNQSYRYDLMEVWAAGTNLGYANSYRLRFDAAISALMQSVKPPSRVLDVAAAQGNFSLTLAEIGYRVTWNDIRAELIDYVRLKYERGSLDFQPGDLFALQSAKPFDAVLACEVIEHVAHPDAFFAGLSNLVKPGGILVLTTPNGAYFRNTLPRFSDCLDPEKFEAKQFQPNADGHIFLLYEDELRSFASACQMEVLDIALTSNPLCCGYLGTAKLLAVLPQQLVSASERFVRVLPRGFQKHLMTNIVAVFRKRGD